MPKKYASFLLMTIDQELLAPGDYLTSAQVMGTIRISRRTLERYVADKKLPVSYLPSGYRRYLRSDVMALLTPQSSPSVSVPPDGPLAEGEHFSSAGDAA